MHNKIKWGVILKRIKICNKGIFFSISYMPMHDIFDCAQKKKKKKKRSKKKQYAFTWLQVCFLGNVRVIW